MRCLSLSTCRFGFRRHLTRLSPVTKCGSAHCPNSYQFKMSIACSVRAEQDRQCTVWAKSRYTVINYILDTYFWPTLCIYRNIEARCCSHCCSVKAIGITYSECVCSLRYLACNAHAPNFRLWLVRLHDILPHYLINGAILEK